MLRKQAKLPVLIPEKLMKVIYDQSAFCCPSNCPQIVQDGVSYKLHDPDFPGQGTFAFTEASKLRERFDAAVASRSLSVNDPSNPAAGTYSFKNEEEMSLFAENAFEALAA